MNCVVCKIEFASKRESAKYCSPRCRKLAFQEKSLSVPNNVQKVSVPVPETFAFYTVTRARDPLKGQEKETDKKSPVRQARYWYEVPLGAVPVIKEGWPQMPSFMNGRQYFLWWKNEFQTNEKGNPVILDPLPSYENVTYKPFRSGLGA